MRTRRSVSLFQLNDRAGISNGAALAGHHKRPLGRRCEQLNLSPAGSVRPGIDLSAAYAAASRPLEKDLGLIGLLGGLPCEFDNPVALGAATKVSRPEDLAAYGRYVGQLAGQFRGEVKVWQSWRDPNKTSGWAGAPDPQLYAGMLELQYDAIKQVDPDAKLAFGPIAGCDLAFTSAVLDALKGRRAFDMVAVRPYRWSGPPTNDVRDVPNEDGVTTVALDWKHEVLALRALFARHGYDCEFIFADFDWTEEEPVELKAETMLAVGIETHDEMLKRQAQHIEDVCIMLRDDPDFEFVTTTLWFDMDEAEVEPADPNELTLTKEFDSGQEPAPAEADQAVNSRAVAG